MPEDLEGEMALGVDLVPRHLPTEKGHLGLCENHCNFSCITHPSKLIQLIILN
ncbi:hypothetical protein DPMN_000174 [Dreissena polymorpha]|uniref:Uncharacterized protein n=1 Tax=Dreissena polymorpha TaxID=45954 RepID=A0A9D4MFB6_DREPO|nr:hypothetical protein DPMN_000174 [Dreissena polymorpha]